LFNTIHSPLSIPKLTHRQHSLPLHPLAEEQCPPTSDWGNQAPQPDEMAEMHTTGSIKIKGVGEICKKGQVLP